jgi:hypothetical protein
MKVDSSKKGIPISCISGRDRYECIDKVGRKEADIVAVDPEDMYLAAKHELSSRAQYNIVEQVMIMTGANIGPPRIIPGGIKVTG